MEKALSTIAELIGISDFRTGRQILRDDKRMRVGELTVVQSWHAFIMPSFEDFGVLGVARAIDTEFRHKTHKGFWRAGMAVVDPESLEARQAAMAAIQDDPIPRAIHSANPFETSDAVILDGIGYEVYTHSHDCKTSFQFFNPCVTGLQQVEAALFSVAKQVVAQSHDRTLSKFLKNWRKYIFDRSEL